MSSFKYSLGKFKWIWAFQFILILFASPSFSQIRFQKMYGYVNSDHAHVICESISGGFIIGGMTKAPGQYDMYLLRIDENGDTLWTRTYGETWHDHINSLSETSDGGIIISAFSDYDVLLFKTDANGSIQWKRLFQLDQSTGGYSVIETLDGGYVLTGTHHDQHWRSFLVKVDGFGVTQFVKIYDGNQHAHTTSVIQMPDSGYFLAGSVYEPPPSSYTDYCILRIDKNGDTLWTKTFGVFNEFDNGFCITRISSDLLIAGCTGSMAPGNALFVHRMDLNGNTIWTKSYSGYLYTTPAEQKIYASETTDGGFLVSTQANGTNDLCLYKMDSAGNIEWVHAYLTGLNVTSTLGSGMPTKDGGYILTGSINGWPAIGAHDVVVVKTDSLGWSGCNEQDLPITALSYPVQLRQQVFNVLSFADSNSVIDFIISSLGTNYTECSSVGIDDFNFDIQIDIFPNPMTDLLNISGLKNNSEITIIDLSGKLIRRFLVHQSRITINASDLNNGFYVLKVTDAQNTFTQKFLKFRESIY